MIHQQVKGAVHRSSLKSRKAKLTRAAFETFFIDREIDLVITTWAKPIAFFPDNLWQREKLSF